MKFVTPLLATVAVLALAGNVLQYERYSTRKPVVTVGGQPISRFEYQTAMEQKAGAPILKKIVYTDLVRQAAAKAGAMPTQAEVDARLADLQRRNPQAAAQANNPATASDFREDLTTDMALENLRIKDISASDAEIASLYDRNKNAFAIPSQVQTTMVASQNQSDAAMAEHLLQQGVSPTTIAAQPRLHVAGVNGFNINMAALPPVERQQIGRTVLAMKAGQIKTLPIQLPGQPQIFLTFKVKQTQATIVPPLSQVKGEVARAVKLQKAITPQAELAALYAANPPTFNVAKYQSFFADVQQYNDRAGKKTASAQ